MLSGNKPQICRIGFLAGLLSLPALANDELSRASALLDLSLAELINVPVTTASRKAASRDQTPAHIMVVTRQQIRERRYKNLADLLEDMPGVDFQRGTKTSQSVTVKVSVAFEFFYAAFFIPSASFLCSGFKVTSVILFQFRVWPLQRSGLAVRAA